MDILSQRMLMGAARGQTPMQLVVDTSISTSYTIYFWNPVNVLVDWGDGSSDPVVNAAGSGATGKSHTWSSTAEYTINVTGSAYGFGQFSVILNQSALTKCLSFGDLGFVKMSGGFLNHISLTEVPEAIPPSVTDLSGLFYDASTFNQNISMWQTANITNMNEMFYGASAFNQNLSAWVTGLTSQPTDFSTGANATFANNANNLKPYLSNGTTRINT